MLMDQYFDAMKAVLTKAEETQRDVILAAADEIAARLEKGKPYSRENTLNSATYLNSLLKKIKQ